MMWHCTLSQIGTAMFVISIPNMYCDFYADRMSYFYRHATSLHTRQSGLQTVLLKLRLSSLLMKRDYPRIVIGQYQNKWTDQTNHNSGIVSCHQLMLGSGWYKQNNALVGGCAPPHVVVLLLPLHYFSFQIKLIQ